jgi:hypothetical protein
MFSRESERADTTTKANGQRLDIMQQMLEQQSQMMK